MVRRIHQPSPNAAAQVLRRKVKRMYERFNEERWEDCFSLLDPRLRDEGRVAIDEYARSLAEFKGVYGSVEPWHMKVSLHMEGAPKQGDRRPFAFVYVVWQDQARGFHMFRERWVKDEGRWYSRVAGLMANGVTSGK